MKEWGLKMSSRDVAVICYKTIKALRESWGDYDLEPWETASPETRDGVHAGVDYYLKNALGTPEDEHYSEWINERCKTHGPRIETREHLFRLIVVTFKDSIVGGVK